MEAGVGLSLGPLEYVRLTLEHVDADAISDSVAVWRRAQDRLSHAYAVYQEYLRDHGHDDRQSRMRDSFASGMDHYHAGRYEQATAQAEVLILRGGLAADVNADGVVNAVDVQLVINAALGLPVSWPTDVNGDGRTNALDIQRVVNAVLGVL